LAETHYLLILSRDLGYLAQAQADPLLTEVDQLARMLSTLRAKVERDSRLSTPDSRRQPR
jgi:four helix bundle protein